MTIEVFPPELRPQRAGFDLRNAWRSGGRNIYGREQRVRGDAGFWVVTLAGLRIHDRSSEYAYRALIARLRDGEAVNVPMFGFRPLLNSADLDDSILTMAASAALRATAITLTSSGVEVRAGGTIGIAGGLHTIKEVTSGPAFPPFENMVANDSPWSDEMPFVDEVDASAAYDVKVSPPLRSAVTAGLIINTRAPTVRCVLESASDGDLEMQPGRVAFPTLNLVEDIE